MSAKLEEIIDGLNDGIWATLDDEQEDFLYEVKQLLIKQQKEIEHLNKVVNGVKDFCESESEEYSKLKMDDKRHKVDRIFFNGKQRAFENVHTHIFNLETEI